jgi:coproporphyrinogen III oxidase-like Fe-S oxidoreductase
MAETMMLGLRLLEGGVNADTFAARHGIPLEDAYGAQIAGLREFGMLVDTGRGVRLTDRGLLLANDVIGRFL